MVRVFGIGRWVFCEICVCVCVCVLVVDGWMDVGR